MDNQIIPYQSTQEFITNILYKSDDNSLYLRDEILLEIFSHLLPKDWLSCQQVNLRWYDITSDSYLWRKMNLGQRVFDKMIRELVPVETLPFRVKRIWFKTSFLSIKTLRPAVAQRVRKARRVKASALQRTARITPKDLLRVHLLYFLPAELRSLELIECDDPDLFVQITDKRLQFLPKGLKEVTFVNCSSITKKGIDYLRKKNITVRIEPKSSIRV
jgi:hypothetical protein